MRYSGMAAAVLLAAVAALGEGTAQVSVRLRAEGVGAVQWREPVASSAALPACDAAALGHVRVALDTGTAHLCNGAAWVELAGGGGAFVPAADPAVDHSGYVAGHGDGTDCGAGLYARGTDAAGNATGCTADNTGTDDQTAVEVPYTPTTPADWTDPDPADAGDALDKVAGDPRWTDARAPTAHAPTHESGGGDPVSALPSGATVGGVSPCLEDGTDCPASGAAGFDTITSGTNTTAAMVVGAGSTLRSTSTGVIGATCVDFDGDGTCNVLQSGSFLQFDADDNGTPEMRLINGQLYGNATDSATVNFGATPSATVANFWLRNNSSNGMGGAVGTVALIVSSTSRVTATLTGATITGTLTSDAQVNTPASRTCADSGDGSPGFLAVTTSGASYLPLTGNDPHGCTASLSETGAVDGQRLEVVLVATAGGTVDFADSSGIQETGAGCSLSLHGSATFRRMSDRWTLTGCIPSN
jgi:hypothetical protein